MIFDFWKKLFSIKLIHSIDPIITPTLLSTFGPSLVKGGFDLLGAGIKGVGAGLTAAQRAEEEEKRRKEEQERADREFFEERKVGVQERGLAGLAFLQQQRTQATTSARGRQFKDLFLNAVRAKGA